jgi:dihydroneopterin aldolase
VQPFVFVFCLLLASLLKKKNMLTVALSGIRFHAPVGAYPEEALIYNELELHISVQQKAALSALPFLDYAMLYKIAKEAVMGPSKYLENILQKIVKNISELYPNTKINVEIRKLNPPLGGEIAYSSVQWESED